MAQENHEQSGQGVNSFSQTQDLSTTESRNIHHGDLVPGTVYLVYEGNHGAAPDRDIVLVSRPS